MGYVQPGKKLTDDAKMKSKFGKNKRNDLLLFIIKTNVNIFFLKSKMRL